MFGQLILLVIARAMLHNWKGEAAESADPFSMTSHCRRYYQHFHSQLCNVQTTPKMTSRFHYTSPPIALHPLPLSFVGGTICIFISESATFKRPLEGPPRFYRCPSHCPSIHDSDGGGILVAQSLGSYPR
jgi:hypothetical protein